MDKYWILLSLILFSFIFILGLSKFLFEEQENCNNLEIQLRALTYAQLMYIYKFAFESVKFYIILTLCF